MARIIKHEEYVEMIENMVSDLTAERDRYKAERDELRDLILGLEQFYKRTGILSFDDIDVTISRIREADKEVLSL